MRISDPSKFSNSSVESPLMNGEPYAYRQSGVECAPTLFNEVILPEVPSFPEPRGIGTKVINYVTGIPDFFSTFRAEACNNEVSLISGKLLAKSVGKTALIPIALGAGLGLGVLGGLAASGAGVIGGGLLGAGLVLGAGPLIVDRVVDAGFDVVTRLAGRWKSSEK
ncbi:MAG: hypothetical protein ACO3XO_01920 [Bdellovibrionota bacterium]|jgi:hypothetical protein